MGDKSNWMRRPAATVLGWLALGLVPVTEAGAGEALLVPYVLCDSTPVGAAGTPRVDTDIHLTLPGTDGPGAVSANPDQEIGYWFFDARGRVQLAGSLAAHANALVPAKWCAMPGVAGNPNVDGRPGYLLFADKLAGDNGGASFVMWGEAWLRRAELAAVASIPVLALADGASPIIDPEGAAGPANEVLYRHGVPERVVPWRNGIKLNNHNGVSSNRYWLSLPYLLPNQIIHFASNSFVFWFDQPCSGGNGGCDRTSVPVEVYNLGGRVQGADSMDLSRLLNLYHVDLADQDGLGEENDPWLAGMAHQESVVVVPPFSVAVNDSGQLFLAIDEGTTPGVDDRAATFGFAGSYHAGVAFSLLYIKAEDAAAPVELEMAKERGFD